MPSPAGWFRAISPIVDTAWGLATGADLAIACVPGHRRPSDRLRGAYLKRLHAAAQRDPALTERFFRVSGLIDPPARLVGPATMARVVRGNLHRGQADDQPATAHLGRRA